MNDRRVINIVVTIMIIRAAVHQINECEKRNVFVYCLEIFIENSFFYFWKNFVKHTFLSGINHGFHLDDVM